MTLSVDISRRLGRFQLTASFEAQEGVTVLFGRSGSGKTSVVKALAGLLRPDAGTIQVGDRVLFDKRSGVDVPVHKRRLGYVFQDSRMFPHLTVRQNLEYARRVTGRGTKRAEDVGALLGISHLLDRRTHGLSGGESQRVAIGRALLSEPDMLLMDEPLGALDALTREKMQGLVLKLWKETGKTIILITHSVEEALLLGERLIVMAPRPGRIHTEYRLPFAEMGVGQDLREVKKHPKFGEVREEILSMIWDMEEEIMGRTESA